MLPPGISIDYHQHNIIEKLYYIMSGRRKITAKNYTWGVRPGDAIPCTLHNSPGIYNNTDEDLELFIFGITTGKEGKDVVDLGDDFSNK